LRRLCSGSLRWHISVDATLRSEASPSVVRMAGDVPGAWVVGKAGVDRANAFASRTQSDEHPTGKPAAGVGNLGAHGVSNAGSDWSGASAQRSNDTRRLRLCARLTRIRRSTEPEGQSKSIHLCRHSGWVARPSSPSDALLHIAATDHRPTRVPRAGSSPAAECRPGLYRDAVGSNPGARRTPFGPSLSRSTHGSGRAGSSAMNRWGQGSDRSAGADDVLERRILPPHDEGDGDYADHPVHNSYDLVAEPGDDTDHRLRP
jgi:hypothetical protein